MAARRRMLTIWVPRDALGFIEDIFFSLNRRPQGSVPRLPSHKGFDSLFQNKR